MRESVCDSVLNVHTQARKHTFFSVFAPPWCGADRHAPPPSAPSSIPSSCASRRRATPPLFRSYWAGAHVVQHREWRCQSFSFASCSRMPLLCLWLWATALLGKVLYAWLCMRLREGVYVCHGAG